MSAFSHKTSMEGPLSKWTNVMKGWQYRWFVLNYQTGLLSYYVSKGKMMRGSRRGCVRLRGALIGIDDQDDSTFTITCDQKTFHFQAQHADERVQWVTALEETILKHSQPARFGGQSRSRPKPTVEDFDRKLAESDAYLQILIDQVSEFEARIERIEDDTEKQKYEQPRIQAKAMIESIKQAIVLLQLAKSTISWPIAEPKNTLNPVNGLISNELDATHNDNLTVEPVVNQTPSETPVIGQETQPTNASSSSVESAAECFEDNNAATVLPTTSRPIQVMPRNENIPALSYSSSDEEDFYDADEFLDLDLGPPQGRLPIEDQEEEDEEQRPRAHKQHPANMYEEESDEEMFDLQGHGSIITHLLSQVRLGMDLTKVVLPTFILERRSLLEMYADFLAHPEIFANISDMESPKDRIIQVVRWFMTAFHAGRSSTIAKKPYNPILGETVRCWWDLGLENGKIDGSEELADGPVPWATKDQVTFVAEQVSHHPPVSAFYAEHYNNQMSINAHIWTKSKFLGLSIGVELVGQACVSDLKHDEEYIMTFPNAYGRSILTVPWFEMGGKCIISCAKTGFTSTVTFMTKPFYGGKKHRVTGEITHVSDRKPFMTIAGEWNGVLTAKYANGDTEEFADTTTMKVNKKRSMPVEQQGEFESKRLWKDVTHYLKTRNIDKATDHKQFLEGRQRDEAKARKEKGEKWQTKFFHDDGECWIFNNPLQKRLKATQDETSQMTGSPVTNSHVPGFHGDGPTVNVTSTKTASQEVLDLLS